MRAGIAERIKSNPNAILWVLFVAAAVGMTVRNLLLPSDDIYTHYNNYIIFKNSFFHFIQGLNLYIHYPAEQYDLYKYSPFFALVFGALSWMPDWLGLAIWNLLNVGVLVFAISRLPQLSQKQQMLFGLLLLQETITATINSQSNALIAGLLILAWVALEKNKLWPAVIFISLTVFIKLFGLVFFALFLFYPRWWKAIIPAVLVVFFLAFFPFVFSGFSSFKMQYTGYLNLLANDHNTFVKYSVMAWLQRWFQLFPSHQLVLFFGTAFQLIITLILVLKKQTVHTKALYAGSWLIWMVIFNHMAESATYVIAVTGVLLWFFYSEQPLWLKLLLIIPVMAFTCFGPSDIYPPALREKIVVTWQLKVFPCIMVWLVIIIELLQTGLRKRNETAVQTAA